jgi:hypothetical protein
MKPFPVLVASVLVLNKGTSNYAPHKKLRKLGYNLTNILTNVYVHAQCEFLLYLGYVSNYHKFVISKLWLILYLHRMTTG